MSYVGIKGHDVQKFNSETWLTELSGLYGCHIHLTQAQDKTVGHSRERFGSRVRNVFEKFVLVY